MTTRVFTRRRVQMLAAQFADGFGGRANSLLLALYAIKLAGISGFSGFTAVGTVGSMVAAAVSGPLSSQVSARWVLRGSALTLTAARLASYAFVAADAGLAPILAMRLVGGVAGTLMTNSAKAQVTGERDPGASIAALNVTNGLGQAAGALAAGAVTAWAPAWGAVALGVTVAALSSLPMARLSAHADHRPAERGVSLAALRAVAPTALLGAFVGMSMGGVGSLRDGLAVQHFSEAWLGAISLAVMAGGLLATPLTARIGRWTDGPRRDAVAWPLLGAAALVGWAAAPRGIALFMLAAAAAELAAQVIGALTEARIIRLTGPRVATQALTAAGAVSALTGTLAVLGAPRMVNALGQGRAAALLAVPLVTVAVWAWTGPILARMPRPAVAGPPANRHLQPAADFHASGGLK